MNKKGICHLPVRELPADCLQPANGDKCLAKITIIKDSIVFNYDRHNLSIAGCLTGDEYIKTNELFMATSVLAGSHGKCSPGPIDFFAKSQGTVGKLDPVKLNGPDFTGDGD